MWDAGRILEVLDEACDAFTFPMLDNGYVYLAATRLSLHRSAHDWAMVIEVFGFSPRAGLPDIGIHTFGSRLHERDPVEQYATRAHWDTYLAEHPHDDSRFRHPIAAGTWIDEEEGELVAEDATEVLVRGRPIALPSLEVWPRHEIVLEDPPRIAVFELCRYLAAVARDEVLASAVERRVSVPPELAEVLVLDAWHHPNVVDEADRPSGSSTFRQLARVLETGDRGLYRPTDPPNTHWQNWPDGGTL